MARPRSSRSAIGSLFLDTYSANKLRLMGSEFESIRKSHESGIKSTLDAIGGIAELQVATMIGIKELGDKLAELSKISGSIADYFEQKEKKENRLGDLKLILLDFEDELDKIDEVSEDFTEYAVLLVEELQGLIQENDVRLEHFKTLPKDDIKWAKDVLERIDSTHLILMSKLREDG